MYFFFKWNATIKELKINILSFSNEVAQFLNLSLPECRAILERYDQELDREVTKVKDK